MRAGLVLALIAAASIAGCDRDAAARNASAEAEAMEQVVVLESDLAQLRADFNAAQGEARLVFIAGPNCAGCLLADLETAVGDIVKAEERLHVFVVFVPTLQAQERHARRAVRFFNGERVRHYWDPSGVTGERFEPTLGIDQYAWDVWMTYAPDAEWREEDPPSPRSWMHQVYGLPEDAKLDPQAFAASVRDLLEELT